MSEIDEHLPRLEEKDMSCWVGWQKPLTPCASGPSPEVQRHASLRCRSPQRYTGTCSPIPNPAAAALSALLSRLSFVLRTSWLVLHWVFHHGECFTALHTSPDPRLMNKGWKYTQMSSWATEQMSNTVCRSWLEAAEPQAGESFHLQGLCIEIGGRLAEETNGISLLLCAFSVPTSGDSWRYGGKCQHPMQDSICPQVTGFIWDFGKTCQVSTVYF